MQGGASPRMSRCRASFASDRYPTNEPSTFRRGSASSRMPALLAPHPCVKVYSQGAAHAYHLLDVAAGDAAFQFADESGGASADFRQFDLGVAELAAPFAQDGPEVLRVAQPSVWIARLCEQGRFAGRHGIGGPSGE